MVQTEQRPARQTAGVGEPSVLQAQIDYASERAKRGHAQPIIPASPDINAECLRGQWNNFESQQALPASTGWDS